MWISVCHIVTNYSCKILIVGRGGGKYRIKDCSTSKKTMKKRTVCKSLKSHKSYESPTANCTADPANVLDQSRADTKSNQNSFKRTTGLHSSKFWSWRHDDTKIVGVEMYLQSFPVSRSTHTTKYMFKEFGLKLDKIYEVIFKLSWIFKAGWPIIVKPPSLISHESQNKYLFTQTRQVLNCIYALLFSRKRTTFFFMRSRHKNNTKSVVMWCITVSAEIQHVRSGTYITRLHRVACQKKLKFLLFVFHYGGLWWRLIHIWRHTFLYSFLFLCYDYLRVTLRVLNLKLNSDT